MFQTAPNPVALLKLVERLTYKPGWLFFLTPDLDRDPGCQGETLVIRITAPDTNDPTHPISVVHYFPVPPATYNEDSWRRWLLDSILKVEQHETCEFFRISGEQPFAPNHGPGEDPYRICELTTATARHTRFTGELVAEHEQLDRIMAQAKENVKEVVAVQRAGESLGGLDDLRLRA